jgi:hypothetical protein
MSLMGIICRIQFSKYGGLMKALNIKLYKPLTCEKQNLHGSEGLVVKFLVQVL